MCSRIPELELVALGSDSLAGQPASALDPRLARNGHGGLPSFVSNAEALAAGAQLVFCCLDHKEAARLEAPPDAVVVDLSGAHRLADTAAYASWYGFAHPGGTTRTGATRCRSCVPPTGRLIANPGCYATAALLALAPLANAIEPDGVVVDAKSGVSGAGRTLKASSHAASVLDNVSPYRIGAHQHEPEIEQLLGFPVCFVPHLMPVRRGLIATCYVQATGEAASAARGRVCGVARRVGASGGNGARPRPGPGNGRSRDRPLRGSRDRALDRHLRPRQPRQGRRGPGGAERQPRSRTGRDRRPAAVRSARPDGRRGPARRDRGWCDHGREGLRRLGRPRGSAARSSTSPSSGRPSRRSARRCSPPTGCRLRRCSSRRLTSRRLSPRRS